MIPEQLQNAVFRFYRVQRNGKLPIDKRWNKDNNYLYFEQDLLKAGNNYGVATGHGGLIVLDFDDETYYNQVKDLLPTTFTVLSARRKLPHLYYFLEGEMISKAKVLNEQKETLVDIQAHGAGVVAPGSTVNKAQYSILHNKPIATITKDKLKEVFKIHIGTKTTKDKQYPAQPGAVGRTIRILRMIGVKQTGEDMFECPLHTMSGKGNLSVMESGWVYCFHEQKRWRDAVDLGYEYAHLKGDQLLKKKLGDIRKYGEERICNN